MKKIYVIIALVTCVTMCSSVNAKMLDNNTFCVCVNDVFVHPDAIKRIVTEVNGDGTFVAEELREWMRKQDFYTISIVEEEGNYIKYHYECNLKNQSEEFKDSEIDWQYLVSEGDYIGMVNDLLEKVISVEEDGISFYTEVGGA